MKYNYTNINFFIVVRDLIVLFVLGVHKMNKGDNKIGIDEKELNRK